jgi:hypothetical protein
MKYRYIKTQYLRGPIYFFRIRTDNSFEIWDDYTNKWKAFSEGNLFNFTKKSDNVGYWDKKKITKEEFDKEIFLMKL